MTSQTKHEITVDPGLLFEKAPLGITVMSPDLRFAYVNPRFTELFGYTREDLPTKEQWFLLAYPDPLYRDRVLTQWKEDQRRLAPTESSQSYQILVQCKDGTTRAVVVHSVFTRDGGQILFYEDSTEQRRTENTLSEALARFEAIVQNTPLVAIQGFNRQGLIHHWNPASEKVFGYAAPEVLDKTIQDIFLDKEMALRFETMLAHVWSTGKIVAPQEWPIVHRDGTQRWVYSSFFPLIGQGEVSEVFCMAVDITSRKEAEESLRDRERKYRLLAENSAEIIWTSTLDGQITYVSPAIQELRGFTPEEFVQMPLEAVFTPHSLAVLHRTVREENAKPKAERWKQRTVELETYSRGKSLTVWSEISARGTRGQDGQLVGLQGVSRDITERRRAEQERQQLQEQLLYAKKMESLGVLAGGIAHDFNNLLTGILGNAELALLELPEQSPAREFIEAVVASGQRGAELSKQMLAYSGKGRFVVQTVRLNEAVEEALSLLPNAIREKARFDCHFDPACPCIDADLPQLRQVIMNLIVNAAESIGETKGDIVLSTSTMECNPAFLREGYADDSAKIGLYACLEVRDAGCGMAPEVQQRIFDPFFTTKFPGRGLGLAATLGIVRGHHGAIHVHSTPGAGSTFKVFFPLSAQTETAPRPQPGKEPRA